MPPRKQRTPSPTSKHPARDLINSVSTFPTSSRVRDLMYGVARAALKSDNCFLQYHFLRSLKSSHLLPKHLRSLKLPTLFVPLPGCDTNGRIAEVTHPHLAAALVKERRRYSNRVRDFLDSTVRFEISHQIIRTRHHTLSFKTLRTKLANLITPPQLRSFLTKLNRVRAQEKHRITSTHSKKFHEAQRASDSTPSPPRAPAPSPPDPQSPTHQSTPDDTPQPHLRPHLHPDSCSPLSHRSNKPKNFHMVGTDTRLTQHCTDLLEHGPKFMLTPTNRQAVKEAATLGLERTICAVRYEYQTRHRPQVHPVPQPSQDHVHSTRQHQPQPPNTTPAPDSLREVASHFEHLNIQEPKPADPNTEKCITELRHTVSTVLEAKNTWKWRPNHLPVQKQALHDTLKSPTTTLLLTDKTNRICGLPTTTAQRKLQDHFTAGWTEIPDDPSKAYEVQANALLADSFRESGLHDTYTLNRLTSRFSRSPPIYALGKDHKPTFPECAVRAVQPISGSAVEKLDLIVSKVLSQVIPYLPLRTSSSEAFIRDHLHPLLSSHPNTPLHQVSLDMVSMYPSLPTDSRAMRVVADYLMQHSHVIDTLGFTINSIINMLSFITSHTYARSGSKFFRQTEGIATGYHSSAPLAEILVAHTYKEALATLPLADHPVTLATYMDDSHSTWYTPTSHIPLLNALNNVWPSLNFTVETDTDGSLPFLDISITTGPGTLTHELYQKPTHSGQYLNYLSHCPESTKINIIRTETSRILKLCSSTSLAWPHLEQLRLNLISSNYPPQLTTLTIAKQVQTHLNDPAPQGAQPRDPDTEPKFILKVPYTNEASLRQITNHAKRSGLGIRVVATSGRTIGSLIKGQLCAPPPSLCQCALHLQGLNCQATHIVYKLTCRTCEQSYIGKTSRRLMDRIEEHESSFRLLQPNTLGVHCREHGFPRGTRGSRDFPRFLQHFSVHILKRHNDTIDTFLSEDREIKSFQPRDLLMNSKKEGNGFVF